jgi:hypothetical protein
MDTEMNTQSQRLVKNILDKYGITSVYHFTDEANLETIEKYGLQSLRNILGLNIDVKHFGAEELSHNLDQRKGLDQYVHLAFIQDHPMYHVAKKRGNLKNPVWLEIDSSILFDENTLFCDKVANQTNANIFGIDKIIKQINFDAMLFETDFYRKIEARKAEIMALSSINPNKIKGITYGK